MEGQVLPDKFLLFKMLWLSWLNQKGGLCVEPSAPRSSPQSQTDGRFSLKFKAGVTAAMAKGRGEGKGQTGRGKGNREGAGVTDQTATEVRSLLIREVRGSGLFQTGLMGAGSVKLSVTPSPPMSTCFLQSVCNTLWCTVGNTCHSKLDAAVDGTKCGENKVTRGNHLAHAPAGRILGAMGCRAQSQQWGASHRIGVSSCRVDMSSWLNLRMAYTSCTGDNSTSLCLLPRRGLSCCYGQPRSARLEGLVHTCVPSFCAHRPAQPGKGRRDAGGCAPGFEGE